MSTHSTRLPAAPASLPSPASRPSPFPVDAATSAFTNALDLASTAAASTYSDSLIDQGGRRRSLEALLPMTPLLPTPRSLSEHTLAGRLARAGLGSPHELRQALAVARESLHTVTYRHDVGINAMAPLYIDPKDAPGWASFVADLDEAKRMGVRAISVDVWWGLVAAQPREPTSGKQVFDWSYYDRVFAAIEAAGLEIVPILSVHQCGGSVGDSCNIPLPPWVWEPGVAPGSSTPNGTVSGYVSEQGASCVYCTTGPQSHQYISLWYDDVAIPLYREYMAAFGEHFGTKYEKSIEQIIVSAGPAGELRYPSYDNPNDNDTNWPVAGALQCFDARALEDFRATIQEKYETLDAVNAAWGTSYRAFSELLPATLPPASDSAGRAAFYTSQRAHDLYAWYHSALMQHGKRLVDSALSIFDPASPLGHTTVGVKIPGIHWTIANPVTPRIAELQCGVVPLDDRLTKASGGYGYQSAFDTLDALNAGNGRIRLHFTCLEMDDTPWDSDGRGRRSDSMPHQLMTWVGSEARWHTVSLGGENALADGLHSVRGWQNIRAAVTSLPYREFTALRLQQIADVRQTWSPAHGACSQLIHDTKIERA